MADNIHLLDVVALTEDLPDKGLLRGQVGTVVEVLAAGAYEVEFNDDAGNTYAVVPLQDRQLMVLHVRPAKVA